MIMEMRDDRGVEEEGEVTWSVRLAVQAVTAGTTKEGSIDCQWVKGEAVETD